MLPVLTKPKWLARWACVTATPLLDTNLTREASVSEQRSTESSRDTNFNFTLMTDMAGFATLLPEECRGGLLDEGKQNISRPSG